MTAKILEGACEGNLCVEGSWPGQMRSLFGDHARFVQTYFSMYKGKYFTGDGCRRDEDGYYWITGRVDDVINVAGHRLGTAEIEKALWWHMHRVAEAAVVGCPHDIKGQGIYAYVTLKIGVVASDALRKELVAWVRKENWADCNAGFYFNGRRACLKTRFWGKSCVASCARSQLTRLKT